MDYKNFKIKIALQLILIVFCIFLSIWSYFTDYLQFSVIGFAIMALLLSLYLYRIIIIQYQKTNDFLESFIVSESNQKFKSMYNDPTFFHLQSHLNRIAENYNELKSDKEAEYQFLQEVTKHLQTVLLVYDKKGFIHLKSEITERWFNSFRANNIEVINKDHPDIYTFIKPENKKLGSKLFRLFLNNTSIHLSISKHQLKIKKNCFFIVVMKDVSDEMAREEVESWQKLIRILRHEIINSITPITSVASTLSATFKEKNYPEVFSEMHYKTISQTYKGLQAIEKRGEGLLSFVKSYKDLTSTPKPDLKPHPVSELFSELSTLTISNPEFNKAEFILNPLDSDFELMIDDRQIMQVLINLIKNASEATIGQPESIIEVTASIESGTKFIRVCDNGIGIAEEEIDNIFIPFYTSKKGGSGIGLSISRQIMHMHNGVLIVKSEKGRTEFSLKFK